MTNLQPSTRVKFDEYLLRVKGVVDAADYFYIKRDGIFDAMPACWKHLEESERRELVVVIGSFYEEAQADTSKDPWSVCNIKNYLDLGFTKLDDIFKYRAAYFASRGDDSVFKSPLLKSSTDTPVAAESKLLDDHDSFSLKPKKLVEEYQDNPGDCTAQGKLFVHMTNFVCTEHVIENKKKNSSDHDMILPNGTRMTLKAKVAAQLEPTAGLDVEMTGNQKKLLNPTPNDVVMSELIDQAQGQRAKKKEAKRRQDVVTGNIGSYSAILNSEDNLKKLQDYNDLAASIGMLNAEKDASKEASNKKKEEEAAEKAKKKAGREAEEIAKREELLPGFKQELERQNVDVILALSDARMRLYVRYYFQQKVVNLTKAKKNQLQQLLRPLLEQHYAREDVIVEEATNDQEIGESELV